jgi:hypothetical protein
VCTCAEHGQPGAVGKAPENGGGAGVSPQMEDKGRNRKAETPKGISKKVPMMRKEK